MGFSNVVKIAKPNQIRSLTTPFIHLDFSLGRGIAEGRWIESFSPEGIGKTTLNLQIAGFITLVEDDVELLYIDAEMSTTEDRIKNVMYGDVGVDLDSGAITINGVDKGTIIKPSTYEESDVLFSGLLNILAKAWKEYDYGWVDVLTSVKF